MIRAIPEIRHRQPDFLKPGPAIGKIPDGGFILNKPVRGITGVEQALPGNPGATIVRALRDLTATIDCCATNATSKGSGTFFHVARHPVLASFGKRFLTPSSPRVALDAQSSIVLEAATRLPRVRRSGAFRVTWSISSTAAAYPEIWLQDRSGGVQSGKSFLNAVQLLFRFSYAFALHHRTLPCCGPRTSGAGCLLPGGRDRLDRSLLRAQGVRGLAGTDRRLVPGRQRRDGRQEPEAARRQAGPGHPDQRPQGENPQPADQAEVHGPGNACRVPDPQGLELRHQADGS